MEYGCIGEKLPHSFSKTIHEKLGPAAYDLIELKPKEVAPFLSQTFERVDCIDFRYFSDDFGEYIQKNKPDIVIYMVNSTDDVLLDFVD